ncbi:ArsR/SmtB family transcription factor [Comamonas sp. NoAH]|uniref:ArsR/SmtB family transcription factor n=1 Tax=Comamonas halotolerans TaxID=3041496 RepID=UPI0024E0ECCB|nr:metalloregulator ArsR/SmtB family transcription factor [Comamonas sp. NoAH]
MVSHESLSEQTAAAAAEMDLASMRAHAAEAVSLLKLLGNEDRLMLLCQIAVQERTVSELEQLTGITQPTLSQQLGVLRRDGLVSTRREGKFIWYQLADARALQLMQVVHQLFCGPAAHGAQT